MAGPVKQITEHVPHVLPALMLRRVLAHTPGQLLCEAEASGSFTTDEGLPRWAMPEAIAQAAALLAGLAEKNRPTGQLAAISDARFHGPRFIPCGSSFEVEVTAPGSSRAGLHALQGKLRLHGSTICEATLVIRPGDPD